MSRSVPERLANTLKEALAGGNKEGAIEATHKALEAGVESISLIQEVIAPYSRKSAIVSNAWGYSSLSSWLRD